MKLTSMSASSKQDKAKYKNAICISIDEQHSRFDFYTMENGDRSSVKHTKKEFNSTLFSPEFSAELTAAVSEFCAQCTFIQDSFILLIIPDSAVTTETLNIPNMSKRKNDDAIEATLSGLYKNRGELVINYRISSQSKQVVTYSLALANKKLLETLSDAAEEGGLVPTCISFKSNTAANAALQLSPKIKTSSFLLLDIKHHSSRFVFVAKGRAVGFYNLPFGFSILRKPKLASEDMLFDHSVAELAVLNAREKAKAKQLTVMNENVDNGADTAEEGTENTTENVASENTENLDEMFGMDENPTADPTQNTTVTIKTLPKKEPRKLPKFMLRPQPTTDEEYGYENFRIFIKWALTLLQANTRLTAQGKPEGVYVNMPSDLEYLFDMTNAEKDENQIEFKKLDLGGVNEEVADYLELFGGLYASQYNRDNNFYI